MSVAVTVVKTVAGLTACLQLFSMGCAHIPFGALWCTSSEAMLRTLATRSATRSGLLKI